MKRFYLSSISGLFMGLASVANADQVFNEDVIVDGNLCAGLDCVDGESFDIHSLKIKADAASMIFDNTGNEIFNGPPRTDWVINTASFFGSLFQIQSLATNNTPFFISPNAAGTSLAIGTQNHVGVGVLSPTANLHIIETSSADILFEAGGPPQSFRLTTNSNGFFLSDATASTVPISVQPGADTHSLVVAGDGNVGIGTDDPLAPLEIRSSESFNFFRISASGAAVNDSVDITFTGGPLGTGQLRYNIVDGDNQEMSLDADGNMVLDGTLTTAGPTCAGGCDRVFDADYELMSIEDHADAMFMKRHLPAVGPTTANAPMNVSETLGNVINELEHAHIYIAQLKAEHVALRDEMMREIAQLSAQISANREE